MSDRDVKPENLAESLDAEWARRGARMLPGNVIVTASGQNAGDFRRRAYAALGLDLPPLPKGWRWT